jgi:hypothetical protein
MIALLPLLQLALGGAEPDTTRVRPVFLEPPHVAVASSIQLLRFDDLRRAPGADTVRRQRGKSFQYSDGYATRLGIHKALSFAMLPLFAASGYTGFRLRKEKTDAPKWLRDLHGPVAGATVILFGMNTLTGAWNMWESRKDPENRTKRILHGALFLAAAGGFAYVTAAGDNIYATGKGNHWHRDVALASMTVSLVSWSLMIF